MYKTYFPVFLILCVTWISCEQVIDVDLNSASPRYVIEGTVTNTEEAHQVKVTQTKSFNEDNDFEGVNQAEVIISDNEGNSEVMVHADSGVYRGNDIAGVPGTTYSLTVNIGDETFTASSTMPEPVFFSNLRIEDQTLFGETFRIPYVVYQDPEGIENYYRHVLYINGEKANSIFVSSDELYEGEPIDRTLGFGGPDNRLEAGDRILVEMQSIDKHVYEYFSTLTQTINRSAASPANPETNISGTVLGYFSAHTIQRRTTDIK